MEITRYVGGKNGSECFLIEFDLPHLCRISFFPSPSSITCGVTRVTDRGRLNTLDRGDFEEPISTPIAPASDVRFLIHFSPEVLRSATNR